MAADGNDKVGYKRPPKSGRFKPGQSGNPRGRPKASKNFFTLLREALDEKVVVRIDGKRKTISKREAMALRLVNDAVGGDRKARADLLALLQKFDGPPTDMPRRFTFKIVHPDQEYDDEDN